MKLYGIDNKGNKSKINITGNKNLEELEEFVFLTNDYDVFNQISPFINERNNNKKINYYEVMLKSKKAINKLYDKYQIKFCDILLNNERVKIGIVIKNIFVDICFGLNYLNNTSVEVLEHEIELAIKNKIMKFYEKK